MYVTQHARKRLRTRYGASAEALADELELQRGEYGTIAYIVCDMPANTRADDGSNGDLLVVLAVDGSVETVYFRRSSQDMTAAYFGARKVIDLRVDPVRGAE
jgi:hypothetical protein